MPGIKRIVLLGCVGLLLFANACFSDDLSDFNNWNKLYALNFVPTDTNIESISVKKIDPLWRKALSIRMEVLPQEFQEFLAKELPNKNSFEATGDFNGDGKPDRALVGVYEDETGKLDRFLIILTEDRSGVWQKSFIATDHAGRAGFSQISWDEKSRRLLWSVCTNCDSWIWVVWKQSSYVAEAGGVVQKSR